MKLRAALALAVAVAGAPAACGPTEVIVTIDSAFGVPCTIDALRVEVSGGDDTEAVELTLAEDDLPGSLTLGTGGDTREATVTVTGLRAGEPFAVASDRVSFDDDSSLELRFLLDRSCVPGPCPAIGVGGFRGLPARAERRSCAGDAYARVDSVFEMRDACDMEAAISGAVFANDPDPDEKEAPSPLDPPVPFPFRFYGQPVEQIWVSTNGYVGFGANPPRALEVNVGGPRSLGDPGGFPARGVLAFWDNLRLGARGICFAVSGASPDRLLWITWKDACFPSGATECGDDPEQGTLTFSVAIEETTDRIYVGYHTMVAAGTTDDRAKGNAATIGITNNVGRACAASACQPDGICQDGTPCGYTEFSAQRKVMLPQLELVPR